MIAGQDPSPAATAALEELCRGYWYPLYAFCRRQGHRPADAEDHTQQFFAGFLASESFRRADPGRGRFRSFLLGCFKNFLANEFQRSQAAKRGGDRTIVSWEAIDPESRYLCEPGDGFSADRLYDHAWALAVLGRAVDGLRAEYAAAEKGALFDALEGFLSGGGAPGDYGEIAARLGMTDSAVKMAVSRLRQRYGQQLRREIAHTLGDAALVEDELRQLASALRR